MSFPIHRHLLGTSLGDWHGARCRGHICELGGNAKEPAGGSDPPGENLLLWRHRPKPTEEGKGKLNTEGQVSQARGPGARESKSSSS